MAVEFFVYYVIDGSSILSFSLADEGWKGLFSLSLLFQKEGGPIDGG